MLWNTSIEHVHFSTIGQCKLVLSRENRWKYWLFNSVIVIIIAFWNKTVSTKMIKNIRWYAIKIIFLCLWSKQCCQSRMIVRRCCNWYDFVRLCHFSAQLCFRPTLFGTPFSAQFWYEKWAEKCQIGGN